MNERSVFQCNGCDRVKPVNEYSPCTRLKRGHVGHCRECMRGYYYRDKEGAKRRNKKRRELPHVKVQEREVQRRFRI